MKESEQATDLWTKIGNKCLSQANTLLDSETVPTAATVETVKGLVETAISIDMLNLRWAEHSRYADRLFRGPHSKDEDLSSEVIKEINRQGQSESGRLFQ